MSIAQRLRIPGAVDESTFRSACCNAPVRVDGRTTQHYVCIACGEACNLREDEADIDTHIESIGPKKTLRVKGKIKNVRRVEPPEVDPDWIL